ncbi:MAG: hypothetical protein AAFQ43_07255, partial [Bacteroidota bacterium]
MPALPPRASGAPSRSTPLASARGRRWPLALAVVALGALSLTLGACDNTVDPTVGTEEPFTLWGYLDPTADQQALRVAAIGGSLGETPEALDATVRSTELGTGRTAVWRDSLVTFADGSQGNVFTTDLVPTPGERVRIEVERSSDGATTSVEVDVPPLIQPEVQTAISTGFEVTFPVRLPGAPRINSSRLVYRLVGLPEAPGDTVDVELPDFRQIEPLPSGEWGIDLPFLEVSRRFLAQTYPGVRPTLVDVRFEVFVANAEWTFTPEEIAQLDEPGTGSNVSDGFGFVGSGYRTSVSWTPSFTAQSRAGFTVEADPAQVLFFNEYSFEGWIELYNPTLEPVVLNDYSLREGAEEDGNPLVPIPLGTTVEPQGFTVLRPGFGIVPNMRIELVGANGDVVQPFTTGLNVGTPFSNTSGGAYPDGFTQTLPDRSDLFQRSLTPTEGGPNRPSTRPFVVNEVQASGASGWAETFADGSVNESAIVRLEAAVVPPDGGELEWVPIARIGGSPFGLIDERDDFPLGSKGGRVLVRYQLIQDRLLVCDDRTFGPRTPEASAGLFPDGDLSTWISGLVPTRGAPNRA